MKLHFTTIVVLLLLVLFLSSSPAFPQAKENEGKHLDSTEIRAFLEKEGFGSLPDGMVVRVSACLSGEAIDSSADSSSVELRETWEFSSNQVRRIEFGNYQDADGKNTHERVESRTFQTKGLCQALLDGKAIEIGARKGKGPEIGFVGSKYDRGIRSIERSIGEEKRYFISSNATGRLSISMLNRTHKLLELSFRCWSKRPK